MPSHVTERDMMLHFGQFGTIEDTYIPRDVAKNSCRGIGFVTFEDPDAVDVVVSMEHALKGVEVVVDRAKPRAPKDVKHESIHPTETFVNNDRWNGPSETLQYVPFDPSCLGRFQSYEDYPNSQSNNCGPRSHVSDEWDAAMNFIASEEAMEATEQALMGLMPNRAPEAARKSSHDMNGAMRTSVERTQRTTDNTTHVQKVRNGPRAFVGGLPRTAVEQDMALYFGQFGTILDVYIPRSKGDKHQNRGIGFLTFKEETALQRTLSYANHCLLGRAIDVKAAVPEARSH